MSIFHRFETIRRVFCYIVNQKETIETTHIETGILKFECNLSISRFSIQLIQAIEKHCVDRHWLTQTVPDEHLHFLLSLRNSSAEKQPVRSM